MPSVDGKSGSQKSFKNELEDGLGPLDDLPGLPNSPGLQSQAEIEIVQNGSKFASISGLKGV